ncbi:non-ribosomal peptide synthetase [Pedobacter alluvionis]|uniref:Amino acid adenylation domain-containing protein n=1 Tax=Pedobacter alluvionis TaxID=475253 RepID=A0A497XTU2_9SPHI|nr:non-ribosomal peptide synthetase [Pedobacter alluvionis]RLJ72741.1 amino acid adenylation domain-containing protein [Pedobacter alluvionis]TFB29414.1 amino acid adenylation domain-containing protein [Pedobacter alluvionis]
MNALEIIAILKKHKVVPKLEDGQLKLVGETRSLTKELIEEIKKNKDVLFTFLKDSNDQLLYTPISRVAVQESYPLSNAQYRLWVMDQFEGGHTAYTITKGFYLKGFVEANHLEAAFHMSVQRHESLRTVFRVIDGEPRQVILPDLKFQIEYEDVSKLESIKSYLRYEVEKSVNWDFDLANGPLMRVKLFRISPEEYAMIFGIHHIVSDGWSVGVLVKEVMHFYEVCCEKTEPVLEELQVHYKDYSAWLDQKINSIKGADFKNFWKSQFEGITEPINLPVDFNRPDIKSYEGAFSKYFFAADFYNSISDFCKVKHVTVFNFFRAVLTVLLYKVSGQKNIVIGTPVSGRNHFELENQIGLYINTLPLSASIIPDESFIDFLNRISTHSFKAFDYQEYPLDKIIDDQNLKRDISRNPLFDVMMVLQNTAISDGTINITQQYGFELGMLDAYLDDDDHKSEGEKRAAKFDLSFYFDKDPENEYFLEIEYSTRLFEKNKINLLFEAFVHIIYQVLANPEGRVKNIEIISSEWKQRILHQYNTPIDTIDEQNIAGLLEPSLKRYKNNNAIVTNERSISYEELASCYHRAAGYLEKIDGLAMNAHIGLLLSRSEWMIISIMAILKTGRAYVPIDIRYPASRINYMIADAELDLILVDDEGMGLLPKDYKGKVLHIDYLKTSGDVGEINNDSSDFREHTAYLIYTSGSTGTPKGVQICQRNTIAFLKWAMDEFAAIDYEILYAATSYCFDLSVFEFFLPLLHGKTIRILQSGTEIPKYLKRENRVMINTVPSVVRTLLEEGVNWAGVAALNMAGEAVPFKVKKEIDYSNIAVRNLYGPSEDTTYSTIYRFEPDDYHFVPIGKPVGFTHLYILDKDQNLLPPGIEGEIYLSGQSVAKGYFNKEELTAERFLDNPFLPEFKMYKTGDLGRWLADGNVEFLGRKDDQVKLRGFRIELEEIQFQLEQHPLISEAVVAIRQIGEDKYLVAYCVSDEMPSSVLLKDFLTQTLPVYMVPDYIINLNSIPLNTNGKVDKSQLPDPIAIVSEHLVIKSPETDTEVLLLNLWKEILGFRDLGVNNNFFDVGGHSLKATRLRTMIAATFAKDLTLHELFSYPTVEEQARIIDQKPKSAGVILSRAAAVDHYPISYAQERLWVLISFEEASKAYNMPAAFKIIGKLNIDLLEDAFREVIRKYEILRTIFSNKGLEPEQIILEPEAIRFSVEEIVLESTLSLEEEARFLQNRWQTPFDLEKGPLLNCFVLATGSRQILSFNMHHIISDGWSVLVLYKNIIQAYHNLSVNGIAGLLGLPLQYKDYAVWQKTAVQAEQIQKQLAYWKNKFAGVLPVIELPVDFNRPAVKTYNGSTHYLEFTTALSNSLYQLSSNSGVSLFMTLLAVMNVLLKKYTNQNDLVIGVPVAGRNYEELEDQIGFFVNTLAIRTIIDPKDSFLSLLKLEKELMLEGFDHQDLPFELLIEALELERDQSRSPLFDVMLVLQNRDTLMEAASQRITDDLKFERILYPSGIAKYDLTFSFSESAEGLSLEVEYNRDLFKKETISRLALHFASLCEKVTENPDIAVKDLSVTDARDNEVYLSCDRTMVNYYQTATIVSTFQHQARLFPENIAVIADNIKLTYRELDEKSGQLAAVLINEYKVQPEQLVALYFERNEWMIIGILAVLKSAAAYIPVDPSYPLSRIDYIMEDSSSKLILSDATFPEKLTPYQELIQYLDISALSYTGEGGQADVQPENLAYIIYTSGTTGKPKGVMIEHRNVTRLIDNEENIFDFNVSDNWSLFHSYAFDFSVWEMFGALLTGGTLVIVPKEVAQNSASFYEFLLEQGITVLNQTPTAFRSLMQINRDRLSVPPVTLRYLIFGGEALAPEILREWHDLVPLCKNINMYGITETTVHVTFKEILSQDIKENISNVGLPIPTLSCYVLDSDLKKVPIGVIGELYVGGAGLARGYLNKPELTAGKFLRNVLTEGDRMYRSGDFARILPNGDLEYIGRQDDQVKIAGHRIELGEIETALKRIEGVSDAIVLPVKNAEEEYELVAYYISVQQVDLPLRQELAEVLPSYMIPAYLVNLPAFPINQNGKLDKKALPNPELTKSNLVEYTPARNDFDLRITAIWEEVLRKEKIGIKDNFFDLGGNSLKATRVLSRIHEVFGVKVDLKNLFTEATIAHLSDYVETVQWMETENESIVDGDNEIIF